MTNLKGFRYLIFNDDDTDGEYRFALSSQQKGYVDDTISDDDRDAVEELIDSLPIGDETNTCTWYIDESDIAECTNICEKFGLTEDEPQWF